MDVYYHPPARPAGELHPLTLAYAGDAIYEMFIRAYVIGQANHRPNQMHRSAVKYVSAKAQARALESLSLSEREQDVVRRGRNAKSGTSPKNTDVLQYRYSTAFECLLGHLYYTGEHERLREVMEQAVRIIEGRAETGAGAQSEERTGLRKPAQRSGEPTADRPAHAASPPISMKPPEMQAPIRPEGG